MWDEVGISSRSGPSKRSSQRSRCGVRAACSRRARDRPSRSARSETCFSSSFRAIGSASPETLGRQPLARGEERPALVVERRRDARARRRRAPRGRAYSGSSASLACAAGAAAPRRPTPPARRAGRSRARPPARRARRRRGRPRRSCAAGRARSRVAIRRPPLGLTERVQLLPGEEIGVPGDDRRLLGDLLLPHAHRPRLLGALDAVALEPRLVLRDRPGAHRSYLDAPPEPLEGRLAPEQLQRLVQPRRDARARHRDADRREHLSAASPRARSQSPFSARLDRLRPSTARARRVPRGRAENRLVQLGRIGLDVAEEEPRELGELAEPPDLLLHERRRLVDALRRPVETLLADEDDEPVGVLPRVEPAQVDAVQPVELRIVERPGLGLTASSGNRSTISSRVMTVVSPSGAQPISARKLSSASGR